MLQLLLYHLWTGKFFLLLVGLAVGFAGLADRVDRNRVKVAAWPLAAIASLVALGILFGSPARTLWIILVLSIPLAILVAASTRGAR